MTSQPPTVGDVIKCKVCRKDMIYGNMVYNLRHHEKCISNKEYEDEGT